MLAVSTTIGVYASLGLLGGFTFNRPVYGVSYGISAGIMTIALGALFGPVGYYLSIGMQVITLIAKAGNLAREQQRQKANNTFSSILSTAA